MSLFDLGGKTAIVTGAAGLLGRQHCQALAEAGAFVVATDSDRDTCAAVAEALGKSGIAIAADVTDPVSLRQLADAVRSLTGRIDVLVNNAAINDKFENPAAALEDSRFENYPLEMWKRSLEVNVTGVFLCSQVIGADMARAGRGSIINVASTYGVVAPDQSLYRDPEGRQRFYKTPVYPTTKGAVLAFTRFLAAYWGGAGVRVNALSPGGVENGQDDFFVAEYSRRTPLGRMAAPTDFRGAVVYLASDASGYMTGANLLVDGGFTAI
ncbi:NAD(P)-dependent dehydrogenase, short-chain alcohol dehydrogenase family [Methylomagnum ishizawai]|uniref:NAD(P)-dependent dehydrogenase, short-chain alcohol dehydrogenase family n=1 Tax=Methylomagnum ishizawai TaxID=1760988 RepID=A0A1Y6D455_9GAMM|nr:SDR family oxidoreductase [Methylomagnum ishizawai]SMF97386.1 NAD(P)-dependent dehydrogenase, short-chain alcohol dehydrogenase family [Methylomagnum ishizawai]